MTKFLLFIFFFISSCKTLTTNWQDFVNQSINSGYTHFSEARNPEETVIFRGSAYNQKEADDIALSGCRKKSDELCGIRRDGLGRYGGTSMTGRVPPTNQPHNIDYSDEDFQNKIINENQRIIKEEYLTNKQQKKLKNQENKKMKQNTLTFDLEKKECEDLGFKKGTEKFGECVLKLSQ